MTINEKYCYRRYKRWLSSGCCLHWTYCNCSLRVQPDREEKHIYKKYKGILECDAE